MKKTTYGVILLILSQAVYYMISNGNCTSDLQLHHIVRIYPYIALFNKSCLAIVLSVILRFTDTDYPFGIFKLFLLL
jgi:hypothetical protein